MQSFLGCSIDVLSWICHRVPKGLNLLITFMYSSMKYPHERPQLQMADRHCDPVFHSSKTPLEIHNNE